MNVMEYWYDPMSDLMTVRFPEPLAYSPELFVQFFPMRIPDLLQNGLWIGVTCAPNEWTAYLEHMVDECAKLQAYDEERVIRMVLKSFKDWFREFERMQTYNPIGNLQA